MKGLFCGGCKAKNNEEYKEVLKKRKKKFWLMFCVGALTAAVSILPVIIGGWESFPIPVNEYQIGIVAGLGVGLMLGCMIAVAKINRILASEDKVKEHRLKETDERELEAANQALQLTAKIILAALYILMIVGGLFVSEILYTCTILIGIFLVSYAVALKFYERVL